ncbi:hypothetical protein DFQ26_002719 [Actinomortierella ambigua]|nr:hypothetical protein DFQ26_002719 [Actinomortierella ambigua]
MSDWPEAGIQHPLSYEDQTTIINGDDTQPRGALILGEKVQSEADLVNEMQRLIANTMRIQYTPSAYHSTFLRELCYMNSCTLKPLSTPAVEVLPVRRLSSEILCTEATCTITGFVTATVSTVDPTFSDANSKPFEAGVRFMFPGFFGFSETRVESMRVSYRFALKRGEKGYVAMVNAQISELVELTGILCFPNEAGWSCRMPDPKPVIVGRHQAVIMNTRDNAPVNIVAFVHT